MSTEPLVYDYDQAGQIIGIVSGAYLKKHKDQLPHTQMGHKVGFSLEQCREIVQMHAVQPAADKAPAEDAPAALLELRPRGARRAKA